MYLGFCVRFSLAGDSKYTSNFSVRGEKICVDSKKQNIAYTADAVGLGNIESSNHNKPNVFICGKITNQKSVIALLQSRGITVNNNPESLLECLFEAYGPSGFGLLEGLYVACFIDHFGAVQVVSSKTAGPSIYYHYDQQNQSLVVSTELKALPKKNRHVREFDDIQNDSIQQRKSRTILKDVFRVSAGHLLSLDLFRSSQTLTQYYSEQRSISLLDEKEAAEKIQKYLTDTVFAYQGEIANCLISGGLDSSVVAYLANQRFDKLNLFSIGTQSANEFEFAEIFANSIGKEFKRIIIDENEFLSKLPELLWLTEHSYSLFNEYLIPVHIAHDQISESADIMLSGYGSDVLFAGFAKPENTLPEVASLVRSEYESTAWSNEASQTLGGFHGFDVGYPFFDSAVVDLSFSVDPYLKHKEGIEKYILRKAFDGKISEQVLYRKKIGIHQGTGCEAYFTYRLNNLGISDNIRREKDRYCYTILKFMLEQDYMPKDIDIAEIDQQFLASLL